MKFFYTEISDINGIVYMKFIHLGCEQYGPDMASYNNFMYVKTKPTLNEARLIYNVVDATSRISTLFGANVKTVELT